MVDRHMFFISGRLQIVTNFSTRSFSNWATAQAHQMHPVLWVQHPAPAVPAVIVANTANKMILRTITNWCWVLSYSQFRNWRRANASWLLIVLTIDVMSDACNSEHMSLQNEGFDENVVFCRKAELSHLARIYRGRNAALNPSTDERSARPSEFYINKQRLNNWRRDLSTRTTAPGA
jgi:hypothetical protein